MGVTAADATGQNSRTDKDMLDGSAIKWRAGICDTRGRE
jgi:hypothetical protein